MKYYEVEFTISPMCSDAADLVSALAGEAGFETFSSHSHGVTGYVQQQLFNQELLDTLLADFPLSATTVTYTVGEAEDRDWNEQWEQQGFSPIAVGTRLIVHDGRHLPASPAEINVEIDAQQAFGTGTHETTQMVCAALLDIVVAGCRVLDCGCGTGILGIVAMKLGASECVAYDIDEWSVDNTRHNAVINHVAVTPLLGDAHILNKVEGLFDIVVANINRNILLHDMSAFSSKMNVGARLILSGFYTADVPLLCAEAEGQQLAVVSSSTKNDWACLVMQKKRDARQHQPRLPQNTSES
jgi:ribosomal protein L11 methyltransferase